MEKAPKFIDPERQASGNMTPDARESEERLLKGDDLERSKDPLGHRLKMVSAAPANSHEHQGPQEVESIDDPEGGFENQLSQNGNRQEKAA